MVDWSLLEISPLAFAAPFSLLLFLSPALWWTTYPLVFPKGFLLTLLSWPPASPWVGSCTHMASAIASKLMTPES